jgi:RNA polymerase sigma-70 factor, ECF subfamily
VTSLEPVSPLLVARAQLGDLRALDALLAAVQAPLFRHLVSVLGDEHAAEDALQETLFTISRRLGTLREPQWFRAWAYRIANRTAMRHGRRSRRAPEAVDPAELSELPADEPEPMDDPEHIASLVASIDSLPPASRSVLRLHYVDGLTQPEISEALEISLGTVKSRLAYGLAALRKRVRAPTSIASRS